MNPPRRREAGLLVPLFALRGHGWGIGEMGDVGAFARWMARAGHGFLQLLPINETSAGERSPYAALSAFALDPIYLTLPEIEDFAAAGGEGALPAADRARLDALRTAADVDYDAVRAVKHAALEIAFARFLDSEWRGGSARARAFERFREAEAGWLADYALFRACRDQRARRAWTTWEPSVRDREPAALARMRTALERTLRFHEYVQWLCGEQWTGAARAAARAGVRLGGDLPFMVGLDSADVWVHRASFSRAASLGAPPDAFNAAGQDWGLPVCRWEAMATDGFAWLRARAARAAALFDAFRVDHVVGFYRMYVITPGDGGAFVPEAEAEQRALGERLLGVVRAAAGGAQVLGEDLGVVPAFVRRSLARLGIPGYRVLRWEAEDGCFRDPPTYPVRSVATSGTHDTSALATWWADELDDAGRRALAAAPALAGLRAAGAAFTPAVHAALLDGLYAAGSDLVVIPIQDAYGGRERINVPATVAPANWSYRLPWTLAELEGEAGAALRERLRALTRRHRRG